MKLIHFATHVLYLTLLHSIHFVLFHFFLVFVFRCCCRHCHRCCRWVLCWARANILTAERAMCMLALKTHAEWMWLIVPKLQPYFLSTRFAPQKHARTHTQTRNSRATVQTSLDVVLHAKLLVQFLLLCICWSTKNGNVHCCNDRMPH